MTRTATMFIALSSALLRVGSVAHADIMYANASRSIGTHVETSGAHQNSGPVNKGTTGLGFFSEGALSWASGDYYMEARAWQQSSCTPTALLLRGGAEWSAAGFPGAGSFYASASSSAAIAFTVAEPTPYYVILSDRYGESVTARISGPLGELAFVAPGSGQGQWQGTLDPGTYSLTVGSTGMGTYYGSGSPHGVGGGWFSVGVGVPAPGVLTTLGLVAIARRPRRSA